MGETVMGLVVIAVGLEAADVGRSCAVSSLIWKQVFCKSCARAC